MNVKKTKVVVFGSKVNTSPLLYGGLPIEEVASFRYLGVELHRSGSMKTAVEHLVAAGKRAVFALRRRCADLKINDPAIICQLFDALVKPVISYACELWVNEAATDSLELIHVFFLKSLLGVNGSTPTRIVLSEFGRFPLKLFWQQQALKYHCRLEDSEPSRLIGLAYHVQLTLASYECLGARWGSWLHRVQAWEGQAGIQQPPTHSVVGGGIAALQDSFVLAPVQGSRLANYVRLYDICEYVFQPYLSTVSNVQFRKCLARFRCSNHCLEVEVGRRTKPTKTPLHERLCKMCSLEAIEDEDHFLLVCPAYEHVRNMFREQLPLGPVTLV